MRIQSKIKKQLCLWLSVTCTFSLAACGKKYADAPELLEPVSGTESYREVSYGDVGSMEILYGSIVQKEYPVFWTTQVEVEDILVNVGDYVQEGQIVATADLDAAKKTQANLQEDRILLVSKYELESKNHELAIQKLQLKQDGQNQLGDTTGAAQTEKEIATEQENANYDTLLYRHQLANYDEQIQAQQEIIDDGTLKAIASGYITYVKQFPYENQVTSAQNVVVISDYEDTYIRVQNKTIKDEILKNYDKYYTMQDGQKIALQEYPYSVQERLAAENQMKYPNLRMQYEDMTKRGAVGTVIPIYLVRNRVEDVLYVGKDSIYEDDKGTFVYVKNGERRERRYIEIGVDDSTNVEILSGLSEGEKVYYTTDAAWPDKYDEYVVEKASDFDAMYYTNRLVVEDSTRRYYKSSYEGTVQDVCISGGSTSVEQGDVIVKIRTDEGSAKLAEMRSDMESMKENREKSVQAHEDRIHSLQTEKQGNPIATESDAQMATGTDAEQEKNPNMQAMLDLDIQMENIDFQIQTLDYEYQVKKAQQDYDEASRNNNGSGVISICAENAGVLYTVYVENGSKVKTGDKLFAIDIPVQEKLAIYINDKNTVPLGTAVQIQDAGEKQLQGIICGSTGTAEGSPEGYYITTKDNKVYITQSIAYDSQMYYVKLEGNADITDIQDAQMLSYPTISLQDVYTIPSDMIYTEKQKREKDVERHYVWKIVDGNLEKQYIEMKSFSVTQDTSKYKKGSTIAVVFNGLSEDDVLAAPVAEEE